MGVSTTGNDKVFELLLVLNMKNENLFIYLFIYFFLLDNCQNLLNLTTTTTTCQQHVV